MTGAVDCCIKHCMALTEASWKGEGTHSARYMMEEAYCQVALVANEHDGHVGVCMLPGILQPACQVVEGFPPAAHGLIQEGVLVIRRTRSALPMRPSVAVGRRHAVTCLVMSYTSNAPAAPL
jgi:hypothetical protein